MDFITVPAILFIIGYFVYKLFELFVCKKERLYLIEHAKDASLEGQKLPILPNMGLNISFSALKWGCFFVGLGLGMLVAFTICLCALGWNEYSSSWYASKVQVVFGGSIFLFGGLGLIIAFIIEMKMKKD